MKLEKILKEIGKQTQEEMDSMDQAGLKNVIVDANTAMKQIRDELDRNAKYTEIKEAKKALEESMKAVNKRQKAKIAYALHRLEE